MNNKKAQIAIVAMFLVFTLSLSVLFFVLPKEKFSASENRYLADAPTLSFENFLDGNLTQELEGDNGGYIPDYFPFRSFFVGVNSYWNYLTGTTVANNYYLSKDGYIIEKPYTTAGLEKNLSVINRFASTFDEVVLMVVPSVGEMMSSKLPKVHAEYKDAEVFDYIYENKADNIKFLDLRESFGDSVVSGEQIYYRTDHHWTSLGAYIAYGYYCDSLGLEYTPMDDFTVKEYSGFYGSTYSGSGYFLTEPDSLEIWESENSKDGMKVSITNEGVTKEYTSPFFEENLKVKDMYTAYLDGIQPTVVIENKNAKTDKTLLIVKDSFAQCAAPFFAETYSKVIMIDLRGNKMPVSTLAKTEGADDVLILYGVSAFSNDSGDLPWLR